MQMNVCEFPNGRIRRLDGSTYPIACQNDAVEQIDGWSFCKTHAGMVRRGCLNDRYTTGETLGEAMIETALFTLATKLGVLIRVVGSKGTS